MLALVRNFWSTGIVSIFEDSTDSFDHCGSTWLCSCLYWWSWAQHDWFSTAKEVDHWLLLQVAILAASFESIHLIFHLFDKTSNGISSTCGLLRVHDYLILRIPVFQARILDRLFLYIPISISYWLPVSGSKSITAAQMWSVFHPIQLKIGEYSISCIVSGIMGLF